MEKPRRVFITGGTRGLGLALARGFLSAGAGVFITGRAEESLSRALGGLAAPDGQGPCGGGWGDAGSLEDMKRLADEAKAFFGQDADLVIVNAGINQPRGKIWEVDFEAASRVFHVDLGGPLAAAKVFMPRLSAIAKTGKPAAIWFIEGHGSNGSVIDGISIYGTAKRALAYLWKALALEAKETGIVVAALSPGIMATDFILDLEQRGNATEWERTKRLFNILADRAETVAAFAVPRILACQRTGKRLAWLTNAKAFARFATAAFRRRSIIE